jgi:hypothetical protein
VPEAGGRVLLFGGYSENFSGEIWQFDTVKRRSRLTGHLPHPLADSKFFRFAGMYVAAGGESGVHIRYPHVVQGTF